MYTGKKEVQDQPVVVVDNLYPMVREREREGEAGRQQEVRWEDGSDL